MTAYSRPTDPNKIMGVYQSLGDVPERRRFYQYSESYEGRDVWMDYLREEKYSSDWAKSTQDRYKRIENEWKGYMEEQGTHHALATPDDVEGWAKQLLEDLTVTTARWKWDGIRAFYKWLLWHTEHPHLYNPFLIAAAGDGPSSTIWEERLNRRKQ